MTYELTVLRALFRATVTSRNLRAQPVSVDDLVVRVGGESRDVRRAIARLARAELVLRSTTGPRLTLAGLAIAASFAAPVAKRTPTPHERATGRPHRPVATREARPPRPSRAA